MAQTYRAHLVALMQRYEQADIWDRTYIRKQMAEALRLWRTGRRPDGNHADLVCTLWCELPTLAPKWKIRYTQTMGWNGLRETPTVWMDSETYANRDAALRMAYHVTTNERFGGLRSEVVPVYHNAWRTYLAPVPKLDWAYVEH